MPRIVALADTHGFHDALTVPEGDILIHAGDLTRLGTLAEIDGAARFFAALPHRHEIGSSTARRASARRRPR